MDRRIGKQGGWVGMIALLLALVIVAYLSKDALTKYMGASGGATTQKRAGTPAEPVDPSSAAPAPTSAVERARDLQDTLQKESEKRGGGY
jgi:hypothetical protein